MSNLNYRPEIIEKFVINFHMFMEELKNYIIVETQYFSYDVTGPCYGNFPMMDKEDYENFLMYMQLISFFNIPSLYEKTSNISIFDIEKRKLSDEFCKIISESLHNLPDKNYENFVYQFFHEFQSHKPSCCSNRGTYFEEIYNIMEDHLQ